MKNIVHTSMGLAAIVLMAGCAADTVPEVQDAVGTVIEAPAQVGDAAMKAKDAVKEVDAVAKDVAEEKMMKDVFTASEMAALSGAESVVLADVSESGASGKAWTAFVNGETLHRATAKNMPPLKDGYFYEGWLVKRPITGQFFSTGEMTQDAVTGEWVLDYRTDGDTTDHKKVVITLEPDDNDPAPAEHIIEN